jgi:hypothetical protein
MKHIDKVADALKASKSIQLFDINWSISEQTDTTYTTASASVYIREGDDEPSISTDDAYEKHATITALVAVGKKIIAAHKKK